MGLLAFNASLSRLSRAQPDPVARALMAFAPTLRSSTGDAQDELPSEMRDDERITIVRNRKPIRHGAAIGFRRPEIAALLGTSWYRPNTQETAETAHEAQPLVVAQADARSFRTSRSVCVEVVCCSVFCSVFAALIARACRPIASTRSQIARSRSRACRCAVRTSGSTLPPHRGCESLILQHKPRW